MKWVWTSMRPGRPSPPQKRRISPVSSFADTSRSFMRPPMRHTCTCPKVTLLGSGAQRRQHHGLGLLLYPAQVVRAEEGLPVDLVDVLGARRAGREPGVGGGHLDTAEGGAVAGGPGEGLGARPAGEGVGGARARGKLGGRCLLPAGGRGVDTRGGRGTEAGGEPGVVLGGALAGDRRDLG